MARPVYLTPLEQSCLARLKTRPGVSDVASERLDDDTLLVTAWHAEYKTRVAVFVIDDLESPDDLDDLYDWCKAEVEDHRRKFFPTDECDWRIGLCCPMEEINPFGPIVTHYESQPWTLAIGLIPGEPPIQEAPPAVSFAAIQTALTLPQVLEMVRQGRGDQPNESLDKAIVCLTQMIERISGTSTRQLPAPQLALPG
jgi:hypothetical protein